jgi:glycosyltransferase involved in cell wall biosynthesis
VADMLMAQLGRDGAAVDPLLVRPDFRPRLTPLLHRNNGRPALMIDRIAHRYWDYPRFLRQRPDADVFHIVDHSYAHLASELPAARVVVTCHDTDAFRTLLAPGPHESSLPRTLVARVLRGLRAAAFVTCDSDATRAELEHHGLVSPDRMSVVPIGVHPSCSPEPCPAADEAAVNVAGPGGGLELLHVGSTIPRKRIDTLLEVLSRVVAVRPDARLLRVGGPFSAEQEAQVAALGLGQNIRVLPFVDRAVLAALYRRASLVLLPSEREGFGLPLVEALACGTPVVASDLPVLREVGGTAAAYCAVGDAGEWSARVLALLEDQKAEPAVWSARRDAGIARAAMFSWARCADAMQEIYASVADARGGK